ncbi:GNAT family N-acetyltransferase [Planktotalea sp.]|uniref:GNAT family N-acetyltransferase n=1 Tax=Planktotalea sp. TaxID=2029877 RepID=UPI003D6AB7F6
MSTIRITKGFHDDERNQVAALYWEAFGEKLSIGLGPDNKALNFLARVADPDFALCARDESGTLLGVAGFKTNEGALINGGLGDLRATYGFLSALWRAALLTIVERKLEQNSLLMDGIFVTKSARGLGLGTALLNAIKQEAETRNCSDVRLDVIDTNPRARSLYEREGFVAGGIQSLGPLKHIFGFSSATEMRFTLRPHSR